MRIKNYFAKFNKISINPEYYCYYIIELLSIMIIIKKIYETKIKLQYVNCK